MTGRPHVVIIGGGFAGLYLAQGLAGRPVRVTIIDRRNHHLFQPMLYQVATAGLAPNDIATSHPVGASGEQHRGRPGEVIRVDTTRPSVYSYSTFRHRVRLLCRRHRCAPRLLGRDEGAECAGTQGPRGCAQIRRCRALLALERVEREPSPSLRGTSTHLSWWAAGPTGVEMAGRDRRAGGAALAPTSAHRSCEAMGAPPRGRPADLLSYAPHLAARAKADLRGLGVEVRAEHVGSRSPPATSSRGVGRSPPARWSGPRARRLRCS
ncbi:MAG: FAD-dependent oxidoreductase [Gemmatimonadales bacterium]|nr:FAD-dependent oxidoreductase [Gemmatimonadales bacterium]